MEVSAQDNLFRISSCEPDDGTAKGTSLQLRLVKAMNERMLRPLDACIRGSGANPEDVAKFWTHYDLSGRRGLLLNFLRGKRPHLDPVSINIRNCTPFKCDAELPQLQKERPFVPATINHRCEMTAATCLGSVASRSTFSGGVVRCARTS
jgi:hypothetical protein